MEDATDRVSEERAAVGHAHDDQAYVDGHGEGVTVCTVHPTVETALRCNKCGRPMCTKCAVRTPVGYRCKECVRGQQDVFYKATSNDYVIAGAVSCGLGLVAGLIVPRLGLFFALILAAVVGSLIAQVVLRLTGHRRGRYTGYVVVAGIVAGSIPALIEPLRLMAQAGAANVAMPPDFILYNLAGPVLYIGIAAFIAFGWFRFGR